MPTFPSYLPGKMREQRSTVVVAAIATTVPKAIGSYTRITGVLRYDKFWSISRWFIEWTDLSRLSFDTDIGAKR